MIIAFFIPKKAAKENKMRKIIQKLVWLGMIGIAIMMGACTPASSPSFKSNFELVGFYYRKTIPQFSVASYYTNSTDKEEILEYAKKAFSWNGHETIILFFFNDRANTPDVTISGVDWPEQYEPYCVAMYSKFPTGLESFEEYPFKK